MRITDHIDLLYPSSDERDRAERRRIKMRDSGSLYIKDLMIGDIKSFITLTGSDKLFALCEELKALSGRAEKKYRKEYSAKLAEYGKIRTQVFELYPSAHIPTVEKLEKSITALRKKLSAMNTEYNQADKKAHELADAQQTIEEYLLQKQSRDQQKRKKRNDLE